MNIRKNKKGIGLPTVLAIVTFIIGTAASLLSITFSQTKLVEKNIENSEAYQSAVYNVDAAVRVMIRGLLIDPTYMTNPENISEVESYFNVSIAPHETVSALWRVTSRVTDTRSVISYLSTKAGSSMSYEEGIDLFSFFSKSLSGTSKDLPTELLTDVLPSYFETYEIDELNPPKASDLDSVKSIAQYVTKNTTFLPITEFLLNQNQIIDGNFYIDGNLTIYSGNTLHIAEGRILFITNNLVMQANSHLIGNVVVGNNMDFNGNASTQSTFIGTAYIGNSFTSNSKINFGLSDRPTFVFSTISNTIYRYIEGYVFFTGKSFTYDVDGVTSTIQGAVYTDSYSVKKGTLIINPIDIRLIYEYFDTYALPYDGSVSIDGSYAYTNPR